MTGTLEPRDEAKMIASILAGDTQLYHELIGPYERSVYLMALSYMKNEAILILTADDLVFELPVGFSERLHARLDQEMTG